MAARMRLDVLLVERGLAPSRERAQALILEGAVSVAGESHPKAGQTEADAQEHPVAQARVQGGAELGGGCQRLDQAAAVAGAARVPASR